METLNPVKRAIDMMGGPKRVADALGVSSPTVCQWALPNCDPKRRPVPVRLCRALSSKSGVPVWDIRPCDWWQIWPELIGAEGAPSVSEQVIETEKNNG